MTCRVPSLTTSHAAKALIVVLGLCSSGFGSCFGNENEGSPYELPSRCRRPVLEIRPGEALPLLVDLECATPDEEVTIGLHTVLSPMSALPDHDSRLPAWLEFTTDASERRGVDQWVVRIPAGEMPTVGDEAQVRLDLFVRFASSSGGWRHYGVFDFTIVVASESAVAPETPPETMPDPEPAGDACGLSEDDRVVLSFEGSWAFLRNDGACEFRPLFALEDDVRLIKNPGWLHLVPHHDAGAWAVEVAPGADYTVGEVGHFTVGRFVDDHDAEPERPFFFEVGAPMGAADWDPSIKLGPATAIPDEVAASGVLPPGVPFDLVPDVTLHRGGDLDAFSVQWSIQLAACGASLVGDVDSISIGGHAIEYHPAFDVAGVTFRTEPLLMASATLETVTIAEPGCYLVTAVFDSGNGTASVQRTIEIADEPIVWIAVEETPGQDEVTFRAMEFYVPVRLEGAVRRYDWTVTRHDDGSSITAYGETCSLVPPDTAYTVHLSVSYQTQTHADEIASVQRASSPGQ